MDPTLTGFQAWIVAVMGISTTILPSSSPVIAMAYNVALDIVNIQLQTISPDIYTLAVYNLGGDNIVNYAQDNPSLPPPNNTYFATLRANFHIGQFVAGVISGSSDVSTSQTVLNPDFMKDFTMANLQQLKTPWGRQYLAFVQDLGPLWGLT
jgi:hypothetical protein